MDNYPRQILIKLIAEYGSSLVDEPGKCKALLLDYCSTYKKEINVLHITSIVGIVKKILAPQSQLPITVILATHTKSLIDQVGLSEEAARWAVESWLLALGIVSDDKFFGDSKINSSSPSNIYISDSDRKPKIMVNEPTEMPAIFIESTTGIEFLFVKGGAFDMGDTFGDGDAEEKPVHSVTVSDFFIGKYPVTQGQWNAIMGNNPSGFKNGKNYPVENVSWNDVQGFIKKLNSHTGKSFRLPTEAEWEYAARSGGKIEKYAGTNGKIEESELEELQKKYRVKGFRAGKVPKSIIRVYHDELSSWTWYSNNSNNQTHPVGQKKPNALGLYDMSGNVWEWCQDWYDGNYYRNSPRDNPQGPSSNGRKVIRGGSCINIPHFVRASYRNWYYPDDRNFNFGFRVTLSV